MNHKNIVILGNGISGISAARQVRKLSNHNITVVSKETDHFFSRTALMYIYMGHMKYEHTKPYEDFFWEKNRINLLRGEVEAIDFKKKCLHFNTKTRYATSHPAPETMEYDELILATGSVPQYYNWPGQDLKGVKGLFSYQDLEYLEHYTPNIKRAVIVGGGLIGVELAEMLSSRKIPVTFLVREKYFFGNAIPKEEAMVISNHLREHRIDLRLETELAEIGGNANGECQLVITNRGDQISCEYVGITTGVRPNIDFLRDTALETDRGILSDEYLRTNIEGVYAVGDCAELRNPPEGRKPIEPVWYTGRTMGFTAANNICGVPTIYDPGIWYNSAKFFDIEYQVYGYVPPVFSQNEDTFFWKDPLKNRCIRLVAEKKSGKLLGIHGLSLRLKHQVCDHWISEGKTMDFAIVNLSLALFDPEFSDRVEKQIIGEYNLQRGKQLSLAKTGRWKSVFSIFKN